MAPPDVLSSQESSPEQSSVIFRGASIGDKYREELRNCKDIRDGGQAKRRAGQGVRGKRSEVLSSWGIHVPEDMIALEGEEMSVDYTYGVPGRPMHEVEATVVVGDAFMGQAEIGQNARHGGREALAHMGLKRDVRNLKIAERIPGNDGVPIGAMEVYWRKDSWDRPVAVEVSYLDSADRKHHELLAFEGNGWVLRERDPSGATTSPRRLGAGYDPLRRLDLRVQEAANINSLGELGIKEYAILMDSSQNAQSYLDFANELVLAIERRVEPMREKMRERREMSIDGMRDRAELVIAQAALPALEEEVASKLRQWSDYVRQQARVRAEPGRWGAFQQSFREQDDDRSGLLLSRALVDPIWAEMERKISDTSACLAFAEKENVVVLTGQWLKRKMNKILGGE